MKKFRADDENVDEAVAEAAAAAEQPKQVSTTEPLFSENAARDEAAKV